MVLVMVLFFVHLEYSYIYVKGKGGAVHHDHCLLCGFLCVCVDLNRVVNCQACIIYLCVY